MVFYNGRKEEPERQILELNTAFPVKLNKENAAIQCRAIVLNVNLGYNMCIMEKCTKLKEYAQFIARVRKYLEEDKNIEMAADRAAEECIKEGILEQILRDNRGEVRSMLLTEYDEQAHIEYEKEISFEQGEIKGVIEMCQEFQVEKQDAVEKIVKNFKLSEEEAVTYIEKYWK